MDRLLTYIDQLKEASPEIWSFILSTGAFIGRILAALLIFFIGRIFARWIARGTKKLMARVGVDKLAEKLRSIDMIGRSSVKIIPSEIFSKLIYYLFLFIILWVAADVLQIEALSEMISKFFDYLPTLFSALIVLIAGLFLADFLKKMIITTTKSLNLQVGGLIANFVFYFLFINVVMIALAQAGIQTDAIKDNISIILAGIVAAFAIGYGFASRALLSSMLSSYYNKRKIHKGDQIAIEDVAGVITDIDNTSFTLQTRDQTTVVIPLSKLLDQKYEIKKKEIVTMQPPSDPAGPKDPT